MDLNGSPRLIMNQPAPTNNPQESSCWLAVLTAVCALSDGKELSVDFKTSSGRRATAFLVNRDNKIDILPGGDIKIYLYARDILPDDNFLKL